MDQEFQIVYVDQPDQSAIGVIGQGLRDFNDQQAGDDNYQGLYFLLHTPDRKVVGGVIGATFWDWFFLNVLWVDEAYRCRGHGHRLLIQAEDEARKRGAKNVYLDTFSFQAPEFYRKCGYTLFGELAEFPPGHQRFFMEKQL